MNPAFPQSDPAFPVMTMDILSSVLSRAGNPGELGKYITEEIRELTGAKCVLLVHHQEATDQINNRIVTMTPIRREGLVQTAEMGLLVETVCRRAEPSLWFPDENDEATPLLRRLGFGLSLGVPLRAGAFQVGALLALGLPDAHHVEAVLTLLKTLSTIVAMSLRNAFLYEQQERIIQERTRDLQTTNHALRASLDEKVVLLKEVHHRVKNNLQIIISLLNLQGGHIQNPEALNILANTQARVRSMALLHESLYRSEDLSRINFADYLRKVTSHLMRSFGSLGSRVSLHSQADGVELGLDQAVPCGLIINELVCNAMKYAFPENRFGAIAVNMTNVDNKQIALTVTDDGIGLPPSFDINKSESLGLQLVRILTTQLGGTLELEHRNGTAFRITFQAKTKQN